MARGRPKNTTCWWCGTTVLSSLYAVRFFSHAYGKIRVRDVCAKCWYANSELRRRGTEVGQ